MPVLTHRPAAGNVTAPFGPRPRPTPTSPATHYGIDYGWGGGDSIYAAAAGTVIDYYYAGAYGNRVRIRHSDGTETWYCHLARASVTQGDKVRAGQLIATMGSTGNVTGKHLHFELRNRSGVAINPASYFNTTSPAGGDGKEIIAMSWDSTFTNPDTGNKAKASAHLVEAATSANRAEAFTRHLDTRVWNTLIPATADKDPMAVGKTGVEAFRRLRGIDEKTGRMGDVLLDIQRQLQAKPQDVGLALKDIQAAIDKIQPGTTNLNVDATALATALGTNEVFLDNLASKISERLSASATVDVALERDV